MAALRGRLWSARFSSFYCPQRGLTAGVQPTWVKRLHWRRFPPYHRHRNPGTVGFVFRAPHLIIVTIVVEVHFGEGGLGHGSRERVVLE